VSRRARAATFLALAGIAAALAAAVANSYGSRVARGYGPLRPVVVAVRGLRGGRALQPDDVAGALAERRVPVRFVPSGALRAAPEAVGLAPATDLPVGSYLVAEQLHPPSHGGQATSLLGPQRRPVEIAVSGAEALLSTGVQGGKAKVDVVVTTEASAASRGRTYVAVAKVPLLALGPGSDGPGPGGTSAATLALTKRQALRLIAAESFARKLTLLPEG
jgi:Flp pilus assembly protein CpaB